MKGPPGDESESEVFEACGQQGEDGKMTYQISVIKLLSVSLIPVATF